MVRPLIGITAGVQLAESPRQKRQEVSVGCGRGFVAGVVRAGGAPLLLPPVVEREAARAMLAAVDGVLLSGGGDVASLEFGREPHPALRLVDPPRDRLEIEVTRLAARRGVPLLGICRGIQVLNIALGGDIVQDIPTEIQGAVRHWNADLGPSLSHTIDVEPSSILATLVGAGRVAVNSYHHQAVGRPARGLRVTARAADGVVEAIEADDGRPILAVQFHPEEVAEEGPAFQAIFDWLVAQARRFRRSRKR